jgi:hypothetical protein
MSTLPSSISRLRIVLLDDARSYEHGAGQRIWHPMERLDGYLEVHTPTDILYDTTVNFEGLFLRFFSSIELRPVDTSVIGTSSTWVPLGDPLLPHDLISLMHYKARTLDVATLAATNPPKVSQTNPTH